MEFELSLKLSGAEASGAAFMGKSGASLCAKGRLERDFGVLFRVQKTLRAALSGKAKRDFSPLHIEARAANGVRQERRGAFMSIPMQRAQNEF